MVTSEIINVLTAHQQGKDVQWSEAGKNDWSDLVKGTYLESDWDFQKYDYRIKPALKIRPYKNAEEFIAAQLKHGIYLQRKPNHPFIIPIKIRDKCIEFYDSSLKLNVDLYHELVTHGATWYDGTLCGVDETEKTNG